MKTEGTNEPLHNENSINCVCLACWRADVAQRKERDAVSILHKRIIGDDPLRLAQLNAERALAFLERNGCKNADIDCSIHGVGKRTLTELLVMFAQAQG